MQNTEIQKTVFYAQNLFLILLTLHTALYMYYMLQNIMIISSMLHGYVYLQFLILTIFYLNMF